MAKIQRLMSWVMTEISSRRHEKREKGRWMKDGGKNPFSRDEMAAPGRCPVSNPKKET
jgi:hypothetical protein